MIYECSKCHAKVKQLASGKCWCKKCKNAYEVKRKASLSSEKIKEINKKERDRYNQKKLKIKESNTVIEFDPNTTKFCIGCKKTKPLDSFYQAKCKGTIRAQCKECASKARQTYYQKNRKKIIQQTTNYKANKIKNDPIFKFEVRLRNRLYRALNGRYKSHSTLEYLGCTPQFFQDWMIFQLYDGMTIENYGKVWHIEHVKPCASFDLSNEADIAKCFCWENLRPLLASKNLHKGTKINNFDIVLQELRTKCFKKITGID